MAARSSRGLKIYMTTAAATADDVTPTGITGAAPAVVSVADATGITAGDLVVIPSGATSMPSLDGRTFVVGSVDGTANTFTLLGSDATGETYTAGTDPVLQQYTATDLVLLCFASLTRNPGTPTTQSVATYCDPTATLSSAVVEAGTYDFTGYIDVSQTDFQELTLAYEDGNQREFMIVLPGNNGSIVFRGTVSAFDYDLPVDGALGYTGTVGLAGRPRHLF